MQKKLPNHSVWPSPRESLGLARVPNGQGSSLIGGSWERGNNNVPNLEEKALKINTVPGRKAVALGSHTAMEMTVKAVTQVSAPAFRSGLRGLMLGVMRNVRTHSRKLWAHTLRQI